MRRLVAVALLLLLVLAFLPGLGVTSAQGSPRVTVVSTYLIHRYGYATINESVTVANNGTAAVQFPSVTIGFGNLSAMIVQSNLTAGFSFASTPAAGGPFTVTSGSSIGAGANVTFALGALLDGAITEGSNNTLQALVLTSPSISVEVSRIVDVVQMPVSTSFTAAPSGLKASLSGSNNTYYATSTNVVPAASSSLARFASSTVEDFNPLHVFAAQRTVTAASNGQPLVTDVVQFENLGTIPLSQIYVSMLAPLTTKVTILTATATEPVLLPPFQVSVASGTINLASFAVGYPSNGVQSDTNFTLTYQYPLGASYYSVSGGQMTVNIPESPPISAFVDSYNLTLSLPHSARVIQGTPVRIFNVTPWQSGTNTLAYSLSAGWFLEGGIPVASVIFLLLLLGLFVARTATSGEAGEAEEEEESSSEQATGMINAFEEKTGVINSMWQDIGAKDPNELDKAYFDELRRRLDDFRSRSLQRLNELKQKSTSQKFSDVLNQIHSTEREVDRAAKDKLNLYQQFYLRQMRKEVFDRLNPQYTKRLEKALNQLSDEIHTVQREAKLL